MAEFNALNIVIEFFSDSCLLVPLRESLGGWGGRTARTAVIAEHSSTALPHHSLFHPLQLISRGHTSASTCSAAPTRTHPERTPSCGNATAKCWLRDTLQVDGQQSGHSQRRTNCGVARQERGTSLSRFFYEMFLEFSRFFCCIAPRKHFRTVYFLLNSVKEGRSGEKG